MSARATRLGAAGLLLPLALLACGREKTEHGSAAAGGAGAQGAAASRPAEEIPLPPEGGVEVSVGVDGIVAAANRAPRRRVLEALARETDLVVVAFVEGGEPEGPVTFRSRGEPIEVVLARALVGVPFSIAPLEGAESQRLGVVVGFQDEAKRTAHRTHAPERPTGRSAGSEAAAPAEPQLSEEKATEQLHSRDPAERVEAVEATDVTSVSGFAAVVDRLANDPDPNVREAAAESLGDADVGAVRPLLEALGDSDSKVVLAALESLESVGDASVVPELAAVLQHHDPAVRERAAEVADFLE